MKILIDARTMGSRPSGIGIYAYRYIKELIKSKHQIILATDVSVSEEMRYLKRKQVPILEYGKEVYQSVEVFKYFGFVRRCLRQEQPDIFWEPNILVPVGLRGYRGKVMITIHDLFPITHRRYFGWKYSIYFRIMLGRTIRRTDSILYDSEETRNTAEKYFPPAAKKQSDVLYVIVPPVQEEKAGAGSEPEDYFLYVGNMEKRKGVDILIEAYERYRDKGGARKLVLAGKSREKEVDALLAATMRRVEGIVYKGYVTPKEKNDLYRSCGCFVFPSAAEGFGICVIEAMQYCKPIIASDLSIFREVAGDAAEYFPLSDDRNECIIALSDKMLNYNGIINPEYYNSIIERYMPERLSNQLLEILEKKA